MVALVHAGDADHSRAGSNGDLMRENPVLSSLLTSSDVTVHVRPLPSGHAAELHGEVCPPEECPPVIRSSIQAEAPMPWMLSIPCCPGSLES